MVTLKIFYLLFYISVLTEISAKHSEIKEHNSVDNETDNSDSDEGPWKGPWFPYPPNEFPTDKPHMQSEKQNTNVTCDDGLHSIEIDFDPNKVQHSYNYLCLSNRSMYEPNMQREALLLKHFIPPAYVPPVKCLNESITIIQELPTYGSFRPLPPKYGTYTFLPPQRWLHSLAEGAIVVLYHPCAVPSQITALQNVVKGCLYRHVITPWQHLSPERPLALLAWGNCLQMSVLDDRTAVEFIKKYAKNGPLKKRNSNVNLYEAGLIAEAHLVTDAEDVEICGYKEM